MTAADRSRTRRLAGVSAATLAGLEPALGRDVNVNLGVNSRVLIGPHGREVDRIASDIRGTKWRPYPLRGDN